jgi:methylamine dehydrogenase accessory protein MauD
MSDSLFLLSYTLLWLIVLSRSLLVLCLFRQVGILHLRIRPAGARVLPHGPGIGDAAPSVKLEDEEGLHEDIAISQAMDKSVLLLFLSQGCPACQSLIPSIEPMIRESTHELSWAVVLSGRGVEAPVFRKQHKLRTPLIARSDTLPKVFKIGPTPYAVLVGSDGRVWAKGLVNTAEHLESLLMGSNPRGTARSREGPSASEFMNVAMSPTPVPSLDPISVRRD